MINISLLRENSFGRKSTHSITIKLLTHFQILKNPIFMQYRQSSKELRIIHI